MIGWRSSKQIESIPNFYVNIHFPLLPTCHQTQGSSVPPSGGVGTRPLPATQNLSGIILGHPTALWRGSEGDLGPGRWWGRRMMCWKGCCHISHDWNGKMAKAGEVPLRVVGGEMGSTGMWWRGSRDTSANRIPPQNVTSGVQQALPVSSTLRGPNAYHTLTKILTFIGNIYYNIIQIIFIRNNKKIFFFLPDIGNFFFYYQIRKKKMVFRNEETIYHWFSNLRVRKTFYVNVLVCWTAPFSARMSPWCGGTFTFHHSSDRFLQ